MAWSGSALMLSACIVMLAVSYNCQACSTNERLERVHHGVQQAHVIGLQGTRRKWTNPYFTQAIGKYDFCAQKKGPRVVCQGDEADNRSHRHTTKENVSCPAHRRQRPHRSDIDAKRRGGGD
eukprot:TRINITY_DN74824_c0_g1_i1.p2 TRINITY_DN74824_c0_g1~~TRINITY_DN74824_c0_g1_i1.p2  ORF type:complete len:122 (+),score=5.55 TRINITY_DN74824_c0_g1_i1:67-432(+)